MSRRAADAPTVSVLIPAHNAGRYLGRTLQSVRAQTFPDFEVIIVDDGSTDDTPEVARAYAERDRRIRLVRQPRAGAAAARNRALAEARGAFVANLDADDLWRPAFLQRTMAALEAGGPRTVFAFARSLWIGPDDELLPQKPVPLPRELDYRELLLRNPIGNGSAALMRTAAVRACGGYDEDLVRAVGQGEDWLLQLRLSWRGPARVVDEPLVRYRIWTSSASHRVEQAAAASWEVIRRCRAEGPPLDAGAYRSAISLMLVWNARRAWRMRHHGVALRLLMQAYVANPAWFLLPELRGPLASLPRKLGRALVARGAADGATSP
jgi:glycosyltransferase involved in cell wall biosynthesis